VARAADPMRRHALCVILTALAAFVTLFACGDDEPAIDSDLPLPRRDDVDAGVDAGGVRPAVDASDAALDDTPEAGCADAGAGCERLVFVTSTTFSGNELGGIAGADAKCQARAAASALLVVKNARFHAWISTNASSVRDRLIHGTSPYRKPLGTIFAKDWTDLTDGTLMSGIDEDESGGVTNGRAWTGTTAAGANGPDQCDAWSPSGNSGRAGAVGNTTTAWTSLSDDGCEQPRHLYCFQE
jgi:hypothetical protein